MIKEENIKPEYTLPEIPNGNDQEMVEKKKKLYSLGQKGFLLIVFLSGLILLGWIFTSF